MLKSLRQAIDRLVTARRQHGLAAALQLLFDRAARRLIGLDVAEVVWLDADRLSESLQASTEFQFRFLDADEVAAFAADSKNELDPSHAKRVRAGNDLCFAALDGGRLAAYGWYAARSIEPEHCFGVALSFPEHVAYMYKGFTHPEYRGQRLHGLIMGLALVALRDRGIRSLISTVHWTNWASLRSCDRLGYVRLGKIVTLGLGPLRIQFHPKSAKRRGVQFGKRAARRDEVVDRVDPGALVLKQMNL